MILLPNIPPPTPTLPSRAVTLLLVEKRPEAHSPTRTIAQAATKHRIATLVLPVVLPADPPPGVSGPGLSRPELLSMGGKRGLLGTSRAGEPGNPGRVRGLGR